MIDERTSVWGSAALVVVDLEGSGAQDRDREAILEIAAVPIVAGWPASPAAYSTLVDPERFIPDRPWISPGLTGRALQGAPRIDQIEQELAARINGRYLVGHNVRVDWRLLHRRCPSITPAGLIDTLRLARDLTTRSARSLTALLDHFGLTARANQATLHGQPHRALWDATATGLLLAELVARRWDTPPSLGELCDVAGLPLDGDSNGLRARQEALF
jgi:DNA polymerase III epsilon subunit-like protein